MNTKKTHTQHTHTNLPMQHKKIHAHNRPTRARQKQRGRAQTTGCIERVGGGCEARKEAMKEGRKRERKEGRKRERERFLIASLELTGIERQGRKEKREREREREREPISYC